jgi:hypothetical protein
MNWLVVEHPVTRADTQQSSAATAALLEVIPMIRFIISSLHGFGNSLVKVMVRPIFARIPCAQKFTLICLDCGTSKIKLEQGIAKHLRNTELEQLTIDELSVAALTTPEME